MSSPVSELETALQGMLGLRPPGVSGSRITAITALCLNNVQVWPETPSPPPLCLGTTDDFVCSRNPS